MDRSFQQPAGGEEDARSGFLKPGQKPICHNRPDYQLGRKVQHGWTKDGRRKIVFIANRFDPACRQHDPNGAALHFNWAELGACEGCRHLHAQGPRIDRRHLADQIANEPVEPGVESDAFFFNDRDDDGDGGDGTDDRKPPTSHPVSGPSM